MNLRFTLKSAITFIFGDEKVHNLHSLWGMCLHFYWTDWLEIYLLYFKTNDIASTYIFVEKFESYTFRKPDTNSSGLNMILKTIVTWLNHN